MSFPWLVADIGGTNARFGLVTRPGAQPEAVAVLPVAEYDGVTDAVAAYLADQAGGARPGAACLAIAGPVEGPRYHLSNAGWSGSVTDLKLPHVELLNDFEALAFSLPHLAGDDLTPIGGPDVPEAGKAKAVLGPGTGLGVAGLVPAGSGWAPVPCEGGHVSVPAVTDLEFEIVRALRADGLPYVDAEHLLSGLGLPRLHRGLALVHGVPLEPAEPIEQARATGSTGVTRAAGANRAAGAAGPAKGTEPTRAAGATGAPAESGAALTASQIVESDDPLCLETIEVFLALLGGFAGNVALTLGARGGIYLGGGILPRIADRARRSQFRTRFETTIPVLNDYITAIATPLIVAEQPALTGAAAWLAQHAAKIALV